MIPYEIDPSLHSAGPTPQQLDDGFSPPAPAPEAKPRDEEDAMDPALWRKSDF